METTTITVRVGPEIAERLKRLADATRRSRSFLAAEAIAEYLTAQEWQVRAIQQGLDQAAGDEGVDLEELKTRWERRLEDSTDAPRK